MSNIYILEPPTSGKVLLVTTVGDIDIELWSREAPKACRNFIQLCMEGYYNNTMFHRVVKGFIAQGGDPTGTGEGGESIYGEPFKDEIHSRLRFTRRGLLAMANAGKDDNGSQFFFTFAPCPDLTNKHTIFGKVTGETLFNMLKLEDAITDCNERPEYPQKILRTEILNNPFQDIVPRFVPEKKERKKKENKKPAGVKNFKLLSFGEEAEEDEAESKEVTASFTGKGKSTHDMLDDPKLSSVPAVETLKKEEEGESAEKAEDEKNVEEEKIAADRLEQVKQKLKRGRVEKKETKVVHKVEDDEDDYYLGKDAVDRKKKKLEEIKKEIHNLKKEYQKDRLKSDESDDEDNDDKNKDKTDNELINDYRSNLEKYRSKQQEFPVKGASREQFTLALLAKFQNKLKAAKDEVPEGEETPNDAGDDVKVDKHWLAHQLNFDDTVPVLAKDANTKADDWFDITDPRNILNKRRRGDDKKPTKKF